MNSRVNRALIFQGGGSLGAYEAGVYKAIKEELSHYSRAKGWETSQYFISASIQFVLVFPAYRFRL